MQTENGAHCRNCGSSLPARAKFCPECGATVGLKTNRRATWVGDDGRIASESAATPLADVPLNGVDSAADPKHGKFWAIVAVGLVALIVVVGIVSQSGAGSGASGDAAGQKSISLDYVMPSVQKVGIPVAVELNITNNGANIPYLILGLEDKDSWVFDGTTAHQADDARSDDQRIEYGPLASGASGAIHLLLAPKKPGNATLDVYVYRSADQVTFDEHYELKAAINP